MAKLTPQQLEAKLRFAGEAIPSMTRRRDGHDYEARRMYLITITVEGRRPLLGHVVGNPEAVEGMPDAPHIELSPLGQAVQQQWMAISHYHPEVEVLALQIMPDHQGRRIRNSTLHPASVPTLCCPIQQPFFLP